MVHEYHVIYSVRYYPRLSVAAVGLGTYYPWIRRSTCIYLLSSIFQGFQIQGKDFLTYHSRQVIWMTAKLSDTCHILRKLPSHLTKLCRLQLSLF